MSARMLYPLGEFEHEAERRAALAKVEAAMIEAGWLDREDL